LGGIFQLKKQNPIYSHLDLKQEEQAQIINAIKCMGMLTENVCVSSKKYAKV